MQRSNKPFYEITNKSSETKSVDILIYGGIGQLDWDTWELKNSAEKFVKDFKALEKDYDRINIRINSPGGSVYHGFPIFNAIASSKKDIHTYNDGLAASMGGVLLLAGKTVHTAKNGLLMIHNASTWMIGHARDLREEADILDKYDGIVAQHFADKSGKSVEDIKSKYLNYKDHFLTADEAKEEGFVDIIEDYESEDAPPENIANMAFGEVMNFYKEKDRTQNEAGLIDRIKASLKKTFNLKEKPEPDPKILNRVQDDEAAAAAAASAATPVVADPTKQSNTTNNESPMDFKNSLDILNKESLTPEDIAAVKAEIAAFTGANEKFTAEEVQAKITDAVTPVQAQLDAVNAEKTTLEGKVNDLTTTNSTLDAENKNLKLDIQAYRKSGVKIDNAASETPDPIEGDDPVENFYSEADAEIKRMRAQMNS